MPTAAIKWTNLHQKHISQPLKCYIEKMGGSILSEHRHRNIWTTHHIHHKYHTTYIPHELSIGMAICKSAEMTAKREGAEVVNR